MKVKDYSSFLKLLSSLRKKLIEYSRKILFLLSIVFTTLNLRIACTVKLPLECTSNIIRNRILYKVHITVARYKKNCWHVKTMFFELMMQHDATWCNIMENSTFFVVRIVGLQHAKNRGVSQIQYDRWIMRQNSRWKNHIEAL